MFSSLLRCVFDCKRNCTDQDGAECDSSEQTSDIFKLDIDCFEESFDYLPMEDLVSVGKTCKRLQQVAGYCFQQNYSGGTFSINGKGIENYWMHVNVNPFIPFVQKIRVWTYNAKYFVNEQSKFQRLKEIHIVQHNATEMFDLITTKTLGKLEVLKMFKCYLGNNFHETIDQCTKLKRLEIEKCKTEYDWLDRKIPTLEHFKILPRENESIEGIPMFLELNPSIRKFSTTSCLLCENQNKFMSSNVKLDNLAILVPSTSEDSLNELYKRLNSLYDSLSKLYNRGLYEKLHLYIEGIPDQALINRLATVDGLIKLYSATIPGMYIYDRLGQIRGFSFEALTNLEEIDVKDSDILTDVEILPNNLVNLKRLHFECGRINHIMPFIRRSVQMQRIKVDWLRTGLHFNEDTGIIDLLALNRERERLPNAKKITLYVEERIYLATKWAMNGNDFASIKLLRSDSFDWDHRFNI